jgi:beta-lactamase regulating signal transducer with metallopeptidase domain
VDAILSVVLSNAVGATVLAVPAALLGWPRRWPALVHSLWLLVLLKLIAPPLFVLPLPALFGPTPEMTQVDTSARETNPVPTERVTEVAAVEDELIPFGVAPRPEGPSTPRAGTFSEAGLPSDHWKSVIVATWVSGSILWWSVCLCRVRAFRNVLRRVRPAPPELQDRVAKLALRLGLKRPPEVGFVTAPVSPLLWGLTRRPRLVLPASLWDRLGEEQRETLLVHELAHLRRRDHWVRVLELAVLGLYWWHPLVWWARRQLQETEEQCCDAWVVWALPGKAEAYATALVETVAFLSRSRAALPVAASGVGKIRFLKRRLTMILRNQTPRGLTWGGLVVVLFLAVCLLPLVGAPAEPPGASRERSPAKSEQAGNQPALAASTRILTNPPGWEAIPSNLQSVNAEEGLPPQNGQGAVSRVMNQQTRDAAEVQKLRNQIEIMEAQLRVKVLQVETARLKLEHAKQDLGRAAELKNRSAISAEDFAKVQQRVDDCALELRLKEAELLEPSVLLQQARRRLSELTRNSQPATNQPNRQGAMSRVFTKTVHDFGRVDSRSNYTFTFGMKAVDTIPLEIRALRTSSAAVRAEADRTRLEPGQSGKVNVTLDASRFRGPKQFQIFIQFEQMKEPAKMFETILIVKADSEVRGERPAAEAKQEATGARVRDLENKVERLLKELEEIRKALKERASDRRPSSGGLEVPGTTTMHTSSEILAIPFHVDEAQKSRVARVVLYSSRDEGSTWQRVAEAPPTERHFRFRATEKGIYWFAVGTVDRDGRREPADSASFRPALKVMVTNH